MKALINHLLATNLDEIVSKSRLHCHARNVHSVMLLEAQGKTIRLFVAEPGHELDRNMPHMFEAGMSVGFHAHHCELTLEVVRGNLFNWTVEVSQSEKHLRVSAYQYESALKGAAVCGFSRIGPARIRSTSIRNLFAGESAYMPASTLHTIGMLSCRDVAAWFVFEGREDSSYSPITYSTAKLDEAVFHDLYQRATTQDVMRLLELAGLV